MKNKFFVTRKYYDRVTRELTNKILEQKRRIEYLENRVGNYELSPCRFDDLMSNLHRALGNMADVYSIICLVHDAFHEIEEDARHD